MYNDSINFGLIKGLLLALLSPFILLLIGIIMIISVIEDYAIEYRTRKNGGVLLKEDWKRL